MVPLKRVNHEEHVNFTLDQRSNTKTLSYRHIFLNIGKLVALIIVVANFMTEGARLYDEMDMFNAEQKPGCGAYIRLRQWLHDSPDICRVDPRQLLCKIFTRWCYPCEHVAGFWICSKTSHRLISECWQVYSKSVHIVYMSQGMV